MTIVSQQAFQSIESGTYLSHQTTMCFVTNTKGVISTSDFLVSGHGEKCGHQFLPEGQQLAGHFALAEATGLPQQALAERQLKAILLPASQHGGEFRQLHPPNLGAQGCEGGRREHGRGGRVKGPGASQENKGGLIVTVGASGGWEGRGGLC